MDASAVQSGRTTGPSPASLSLQGALRRPPRAPLREQQHTACRGRERERRAAAHLSGEQSACARRWLLIGGFVAGSAMVAPHWWVCGGRELEAREAGGPRLAHRCAKERGPRKRAPPRGRGGGWAPRLALPGHVFVRTVQFGDASSTRMPLRSERLGIHAEARRLPQPATCSGGPGWPAVPPGAPARSLVHAAPPGSA